MTSDNSFEETSAMLAEKYHISTRDLRGNPPDIEAAALLDHTLASRWVVLPIEQKDNRLWVAMADPLDLQLISDLRDITGLYIEPVLAEEQDILYFLNKLYSSIKIKNIASQFLVDENIRKKQYQFNAELRKQVQSAPVVKLVDSLIESAVLYQASDIHIEPHEHIVRARFRIDGQLANPQFISGYLLPNIISRLKIMGSMNIAEKRLPQDGSFSLSIRGKPVDFRLSTLPTQYGEKAVIRLLYSQNERLDIYQLGFFEEDMAVINHLFRSSHGSVIITGPTGSGKTTTLTSFLSELNQENVNIITVEDPVENPLDGVNHVSVDTKAGFDFPRALRHILRQDPNIIMVGEIRDSETAKIAMRAAITGHLVLSTLHTNDAVGVFPRLVDLGVDPYMIVDALNGVIAQRLVRRLCTFCKKPGIPTPFESQLTGLSASENVYVPAGCNNCNHTGYRGRFAIYEYIVIDSAMRREMGIARYDLIQVEKIMNKNRKTMLQNGVQNCILGNTSASEVIKAVFRE